MKRLNKKRLEELHPKEREEYLHKFDAVRELKRVNPLYFFNHPTLGTHPQHKLQMEFLMLQIRSKCIFGGNQSGKSYGGAGDDAIQLVERRFIPPHLMPAKKWEPPFYCRIFSADLSHQMFQIQEKLQDLLPKEELINGKWKDSYNKVHRILYLNSGSKVEFMSYDQETKSLGGVTIHRVHYDEEPPKRVWDESQPRLSINHGDEIFTMTPQEGLSWTYYDMWLASGGEDDNYEQHLWINEDEKKASVVIDIDDNPYLTKEAKEDTIKGYSDEVKRARKSGRFVHFAGMVYGEFKDNEHVVSLIKEDDPLSRKPFSHSLRRREAEKGVRVPEANVVVAIDPGLLKTGVVWGAFDENNFVTVFDELYVSDWTIKDVCLEIQRINAYHEIKPIYYVIDPHARDRSKQTGRSDQSEFTKYGIYTMLGQNAVQAGINEVKQRLRDRSLVISSSCVNLIKEFHVYRWKEPSIRTDEDAKPEPIKSQDHLLDALRYMAMCRPYLPVYAESDARNPLERLMDEHKESVRNPQPLSEFGGGVFL